jgi:hypothetical protein
VAAVRDRYDWSGLIAAISIMVGWSLLTSLPMVLASWSTHSPPGTGVVVLAGYLVTGSAAAWAQLRGPGLDGRAVLASSAVLIAGAVVTALASPTVCSTRPTGPSPTRAGSRSSSCGGVRRRTCSPSVSACGRRWPSSSSPAAGPIGSAGQT